MEIRKYKTRSQGKNSDRSTESQEDSLPETPGFYQTEDSHVKEFRERWKEFTRGDWYGFD